MQVSRALLGAATVLTLVSKAARVSLGDTASTEGARTWEGSDLESLVQKHGAGDNVTFDVSIASGNAIGRLHVALMSSAGGAFPQVTNQGFATKKVEEVYWATGSILGKDDTSAWPIAPDGPAGGAASFAFDHGASELVFGDVLDGHGVFHRMEFDELVYRKAKAQGQAQGAPFFPGSPAGFQDPYQQTADQAVAQHLREEQKESSIALGSWHKDGYLAHASKHVSYAPRLRAKKQFWEDVGGRFDKVTMQRPSIMDIDNLFVEDPNVADVMLRTSVQVNKDGHYQGKPGPWPSLGKCKASKSLVNRLLELSKHVLNKNFFCGRNANEQCASQAECEALGGRWKEKYCDAAVEGSGEACGCCKEIGTRPPPPQGGPVSARMYVEWIAPLLRKHSCVPIEAKWAKAGASSFFIAMGWATEGDVESLDIDLSLVPLTREKQVIKDKVVFFNNQVPRSLACPGSYGVRQDAFAMRAFSDDRSGDSPGDDEMVKINLACLAEAHPDVDAVVVTANIYRPRGLTWNMLDSVYMRFIAGGQEMRHGDNFFVQDAESVASFVRLTGDATKADPSMENDGLAVGMLFRDAQGDWAFAGLMEGVTGQSALHAAPQIERVAQGLSYPVSEDWDSGFGTATDSGRPKTAKCIEQQAQLS